MEHAQLIKEIVESDSNPRWNQRAIAKEVGTSGQTIYEITAGRRKEIKDSLGQKLRALHKKVCG